MGKTMEYRSRVEHEGETGEIRVEITDRNVRAMAKLFGWKGEGGWGRRRSVAWEYIENIEFVEVTVRMKS